MDLYYNFKDLADRAASTIVGDTPADESTVDAVDPVVSDEEEQGTLEWIAGKIESNFKETRDALLDTTEEIADKTSSNAADGAFWLAVGGPAGLAIGGIVLAIALNPSLATNAISDLGKAFK